jgi:hypothetical protein
LGRFSFFSAFLSDKENGRKSAINNLENYWVLWHCFTRINIHFTRGIDSSGGNAHSSPLADDDGGGGTWPNFGDSPWMDQNGNTGLSRERPVLQSSA